MIPFQYVGSDQGRLTISAPELFGQNIELTDYFMDPDWTEIDPFIRVQRTSLDGHVNVGFKPRGPIYIGILVKNGSRDASVFEIISRYCENSGSLVNINGQYTKMLDGKTCFFENAYIQRNPYGCDGYKAFNFVCTLFSPPHS